MQGRRNGTSSAVGIVALLVQQVVLGRFGLGLGRDLTKRPWVGEGTGTPTYQTKPTLKTSLQQSRPTCFYANGVSRCLLSPGASETGTGKQVKV